ncbi:MAG TPA: TlpA disulfide reductase family protein [Thermoanaerobaculia bacterium]|nr:TlpA disulfide reductase family protein [Thermoanaerobaculia bacterium]
MLAKEVVSEYGAKAAFGVEDFGASPLADRFGIDKYPALFVDEVLVARPEDFYEWGGTAKGKYMPWSELENRRKFQRDLKKMIEIRLAGGNVLPTETKPAPPSARPLPAVQVVDLAGKPFTLADYRGKPLLIEFWATWCPPCLHTMEWLKELDPASANVVAIAVESDRAAVDKVLARYEPRGRFAMATPEVLQAFGGLPAVPTLFLADGKGRIVRVFYGAPPDLHEQIAKELKKLKG